MMGHSARPNNDAPGVFLANGSWDGAHTRTCTIEFLQTGTPMASPKEGDKAPDFSLETADGKQMSLNDLKGLNVVLYFYPKDNTSGCTTEACAFNDNLKKLEKSGAVVVGVSADSVASHQKFADKYKLAFPLLSDEKKEMIKKYGVWKEKSMYGRKYMGIERTTFLIDRKGVIVKIFPKVKVNGHVDEVLEALGQV
jgi:peroxiredoxin Q/BCP